jgi:3-hydroxymyristoyl/3-hydroxydecanoyl-(acyl carrier protein) dehydratase
MSDSPRQDSLAASREDILSILPHRPPFLFVDRVVKLAPGLLIAAERDIKADEPWFRGHFPGRPILPGVLVTDALAQTAGLLWGLSRKVKGIEPDSRGFLLAAANMKFFNPAVPGEVLAMSARGERKFGDLYSYHVEAQAGRRIVATGVVTLAMIAEAA